ncbi:MAG: NAD(P)/FAD-dependent oxidoreductase [Dehalococcoidia bacterium]
MSAEPRTSGEATSGEPPVVIIGGGPAGSTLGCYLSMAGIPNVIVERAVHPRTHVGESMVMSTVRIFEEIGFLETMEREGFPKKSGASWHPRERLVEFDIAFGEFPQKGIRQDYTYHVDRARFDLLLLKHAEKLGSRVIQGVPVQRVLFDGDRACGVEVEVTGKSVAIDASVVADASGRDTVLGRQLRIKENDAIFDQFAVHAWYEGVDRAAGGTKDYIHIYFLPADRGWAWQIPITDSITSMGVVAEKKVFRQFKGNPDAFFTKNVESNLGLARAMRNARRINDFKQEGNYSYCLSRFSGDGYVILGDAARFVDPIFSSGVSVAMHGAKFAAGAIERAIVSGCSQSEAFREYEAKTRAGVAIWYEFIRLYYKLLPMFTRFIRSPEHRLGVLRLLQGDVYDRTEVPVLDAMRDFVRAVDESENHLLKDALTDIPID